MTWATAGIVIDDPEQEGYIGATKHTNNAGELTAMHAMLCRVMSRRAGAVVETMHSDSLYAINMTTGKWMPRSGRQRCDDTRPPEHVAATAATTAGRIRAETRAIPYWCTRQ